MWQETIKKEKNQDFFISHGFICEIFRHPEHLNLNGYIYVLPGHPWHGKHYDDLNIEIHGGITHSGMDNDGMWRLGFDTCHFGDLIPKFHEVGLSLGGEDVYRDWDYVTNELENLAKQAFDVMEYIVEIEVEKILAKKLLLIK